MRTFFPIVFFALGCSTNLPTNPQDNPDFTVPSQSGDMSTPPPDLTSPPPDLTPPPPDLTQTGDPCANCKALGEICCYEGSGMAVTTSCKQKAQCMGSTAACRVMSECPGSSCCADIKFANNGSFTFDSSCRADCPLGYDVAHGTATSRLCVSNNDCGGNLPDCCSAGGIRFCASKLGAALYNYTCP